MFLTICSGKSHLKCGKKSILRWRCVLVNVIEEWFRTQRELLIQHNQNKLIVKTGDTGSGKSFSGLTLGERLKPEVFNPVKHIAYFDAFDFLKVIKRAHKGDVVMFDEVGVGMDSREWNSRSNILMTKILQTFRTKNLYVIFTAPDFSFVDVKARKVFHNFVLMKGINYKKQISRGKWYDIIKNRFDGTFFYKTMQVEVNNRRFELGEITYSKPSQDIIDA